MFFNNVNDRDFLSLPINLEFGVEGFFIGVPTVIGSKGIEKIIEFSLTDEEKSALENTLNAVKKTVSETKL